MKTNFSKWRNRGIKEKFGLIFFLLLALVLLIGITSYSSFLYINTMGDRISQSNNIVQLVLDMDRCLERARRLHSDFLINYQRIGLQKAHELYAQPSVRESARAIELSSKLKKLLFSQDSHLLDGIQRSEVNLYLASAKRFADTSIEAVELISKRSAPTSGIESQLLLTDRKTGETLQDHPRLFSLFAKAQSNYKDYLIRRKRPQMQACLNILHAIETEVANDPTFSPEVRRSLPADIRKMENLASKLLATDLAISSKLNDFSLQAWAIAPISDSLTKQTREAAELAENGIKKAYRAANLIILISIFLAILAVISIARLVHNNIIRNVLALTKAAGAISGGRLQIQVAKTSDDELGQLADSFNYMAARLNDLIENLEAKVKRRTKDLSLSEERFRTLVNELPLIAVQGFNSKREIVYWNKASTDILGFTEEEVLGKTFEEMIFPEPMQAGMRETIESWLDSGIEPPQAEQILMDRNGQERPVYSAYAMQISSLGDKIMYCIHVDLAELKLAEAKSEISESFYRQLFDHSSSGVAVYEAVEDGGDFICKDFNRAGEEIEKISRDEVIGRSIADVFPGIGKFGILDALREVWKTGMPLEFPENYYRDGRIQGWRESKIYRLPTGEVVIIYNDITGRKEAEEEKNAMGLRLQRAQKMEAIGLMAGGIAHDLNNILSAIIGYPELLLLQLPAESELRTHILAIKEAGERAATVVADLLTVARGVASARSLADVNTLVREYLDSPEFIYLRDQYPNIRFETDLVEDLPPIDCSPVHVKKCLMNLVGNGVEAIVNTGTVTISSTTFTADHHWRAEQGLESAEYVVLSVGDNGSGIDACDLEHIFEPFYTKKVMGKRSGTGLGLSVVWNTMKEHGGIVLVDSTDAGSSFDLYFPAAAGKSLVPGKIPAEVKIQGNGERVLIVDDEPQQCRLAKSMLEHFGYTATSVQSGEDAVAYLEDHDVDLLLLDMLMDPGINGRETFERIKKLKPEQKAVIASGFSESEDVKATLNMGACNFIKKPYTMAELGQAIQQALTREFSST